MVGFVGLTLEIAYTRIVSFKLFYYYTYFVIGLALLGFGAAATVTALSDRLRRREVLDTVRILAPRSALVGVLSYLLVARIPTDVNDIWTSASLGRAGFEFLVRDRGRAGVDRRVLRARAGHLAADRRRLGATCGACTSGILPARRSAACSQCRSSARSAHRRWCCCRWSPSPASGW